MDSLPNNSETLKKTTRPFLTIDRVTFIPKWITTEGGVNPIAGVVPILLYRERLVGSALNFVPIFFSQHLNVCKLQRVAWWGGILLTHGLIYFTGPSISGTLIPTFPSSPTHENISRMTARIWHMLQNMERKCYIALPFQLFRFMIVNAKHRKALATCHS